MTNLFQKFIKNGVEITMPVIPEVNTKTFYLSGTSDLTTAQAVLDYYNGDNNPIISYADKVYTISYVWNDHIDFIENKVEHTTSSGDTTISQGKITINFSSSTVSSVVISSEDIATVKKQFVVVSQLPEVAQADEDKVYILGPTGDGNDKYEEWVVTSQPGGHFESASTIEHDFVEFSSSENPVWNANHTITNKYVGINNLSYSGEGGYIDDSDGSQKDVAFQYMTMPYIWTIDDTPYMGGIPIICQHEASGSFDVYYSDSPLTWVESAQKTRTKIGERSLIAGDRVTISNDVISADKQFEVVNTLPSIAQASEDKVYILRPIGRGADKYEEWIVKDFGPGHFESDSEITMVNIDLTENRYYEGAPVYWGLNNLNMDTSHCTSYIEDSASSEIGWSSDEELPYICTEFESPATSSSITGYISCDGQYSVDTATIDLYYSSSELTWSEGGKQWIKIGETSDIVVSDSTPADEDVLRREAFNDGCLDDTYKYYNGRNWVVIESVEYNSLPPGMRVNDKGRLWFDTTNNILKYYDHNNGHEWKPVGGIVSDAGDGIVINANGEISVDTTFVQEKLTAGTNVQISNANVISATDTTYTAGTGLTLSGTEFSADTTVLATKADIANLGGFTVVDTLPSASSADEKTIYLLGPIGTGADKYEEWIVVNNQPGFVSDGNMTMRTVSWTNQDRYVTIVDDSSPAVYWAIDNYTMSGDEDGFVIYTGTSDTAFASRDDQMPYIFYQGEPEAISGVWLKSGDGTFSSSISFYTSNAPITWSQGGKAWTKIGETSIDLSGYATTSALTSGLATKQDALTAGTNIQIAQNGTISATDTTYNAGTGIEIGTVQDYSAMQGPAPDGFHVPLSSELTGLKGIMDGLSLTTGDDWRINLHIPFAGSRKGTDASFRNQGTHGYLGCSSAQLNNSYTYDICLTSSGVFSNAYIERTLAHSLRCFKNSYIAPDSTWTVVQGTLGSAGIFWNQSEGLISITNGSGGYTIMDKNLGATVVYNDGDTLTQANMGNMYQRGNNYGFPSTGSVTTSSTQVDASNYGPGNYYSSSTFITRSTSPYNWSSVTNNNLRGGETGVVTLNNVINNTGVLSVNGQTGDVTIQTGGTYTAGDGIDIDANDVISVDSTYMSGYIPRSNGIYPDNLADSVLYYGEYLNGGVTTALGLASDQIGVRANIDQQNRNRAYLEYYNGAVDLYLSDTVSGTNTTAMYKSTGIESTAGGTTETFEFQGTGNDKIARLSDLSGKQDTLTAGDNITISQADESDMRGPAPSGFHVPLQSEWAAVYGVLITTFSLANNNTTMGTYLKLPSRGFRSYITTRVNNISDGAYWASNLYDINRVYCFFISSQSVNPKTVHDRSDALFIRSFKNSPVIPDSSWTMLYDGSSVASGAGIFWNSSLGLISISGDGSTWYTIMDKNLGATTVYNRGDTLTDANCGGYFQWGNNYMFPAADSSETITTSSTQVDASTYGPGNYYSSSTFIKNNPRNSNAALTDNLRGGVSQGTRQGSGLIISATDTTYSAGTGISIDANNQISNTLPGPVVSATAPSNPSEGDTWYDTTNDIFKTYDGTNWNVTSDFPGMTILSYGHNTWQDFLDAYNRNAIVYCRASSNSNPGTGVQGRMAFMAFVGFSGTTPTNVEFQYYRSRSDHNTQANELDEVYVYKLENTKGGKWTVTQRNTAAKTVAGTGISLGWGSGNMTITNSLPGATVSTTEPSSPTKGMQWYDSTNDVLKIYNGTEWKTLAYAV